MPSHCPRLRIVRFVEYKSDRSEVTEADRQAERQLSERLLAARPNHSLFGEEHGVTGNELSPWQWIVDPIDGTSGFTRGIPIWATLIGLHHADDGLCVSVVSAPASVVAGGRPRWRHLGDGRRCAVSGIDNINDAQVNVILNDGWRGSVMRKRSSISTMTARRSRGWRFLAALSRRRRCDGCRSRRGRGPTVRSGRSSTSCRRSGRLVHESPRRTEPCRPNRD